METNTPPLDPSFAPVLLFNCGPGGVDPDQESSAAAGGASRLLYSIPKRRLLVARGFDHIAARDINSWVTPQGWVLTVDAGTRAAALRDPFAASRRAVRLPPDRESFLASSVDTRCVLSTDRPATDPGCVVLVIHRTEPVLCYCRPGSGGQWFRHEYRPEPLVDGDDEHHGRANIIKAICGLTAAGSSGKFCTHISWDSKLATLAFSPAGPTLSSSRVMHCCPFPTGCTYTESCLVESCGDLFMVQFCYTRLCARRMLLVEVKKLELAENVFAKVTELGDNRVFFVARGQFGASMAAEDLGLKPNCIYFSNSNDKGLYVYDMEQGTTSLHNPGPDVPDSMQPILLMPVT